MDPHNRQSNADISHAVGALIDDAERLLCDLIAIRSLSGSEEPAVRRMAEAFTGMNCAAELQPIANTIRDDPDYSFTEAGLDYTGRHNLICRFGKAAGGRSAVLQTHLDVVPAADWADAFTPRIQDGVVFGRGACDCKGQAVTLWLALAALNRAGISLDGEVTTQFVIEEEIGGNGALAAILEGDRADGVVVLEATGFNVHPACRGACWFRYTIEGQSVHMGRKHEGVSAFEKAMTLCRALDAYEVRLVASSRNQPLFERYERPIQVNVGVVQAGDWPSMVPGRCVIEGGVGFLPNRPMRTIQDDLRALIAETGDSWLAEHTTLDFPKLHNDAYAIDPADPLVTSLADTCRASGLPTEVFGWNVSCDSRLYALRGGMPTVVFGPGDLSYAHSDHEQIRMEDVRRAAEALAVWLVEWTGS